MIFIDRSIPTSDRHPPNYTLAITALRKAYALDPRKKLRPGGSPGGYVSGESERLLSTVLQGFYQSHQATAASCQVNNIHLIRGVIGRPGCGVLHLSNVRTDNAPKVRFCATVGEEPEIELALV